MMNSNFILTNIFLFFLPLKFGANDDKQDFG
jgi:hypothetical protein